MSDHARIDLPDGVKPLQPTRPALRPANLAESAARVLAMLSGPDRLTVAVNDPQRHTASQAVLAELLELLPLDSILLVVATGTHRFPPNRQEAFESPFRSMGIREIDWHDATRAQLAEIGRAGRTWRGHRWLIDDRPVLAIGSVEPHYFAGFTGAHKTCTIGLAGRDDIERNHASALSDQAMPCRTDGNPVYEGIAAMVEQLSQVQNVAVINLVQTGPQIIAASAGGVIESLADLADIARRAFTVSIDRPADAVIAEVQGPLACSFYQSDKAIKNTETAVRDGGLIVLVSPCSEGIGQDHFVSLLDDAPTANQAMDLVNRRGYRLGDHKAVRLRRLTDPTERNVTVAVVSEGLRPDHARRLGLTLCNSVEQALSAAGIDPRTSDVYHLSDAGNTCLLVR